ncbi:M56 family metallopeptidase [Mitsuaria sp. GD03876]|uniref:M56 family metallopeptidase n=1 Tax=Mitsuaria sp. GD03876 TaxID=2975399 RepID=UPI00244B9908|nr:M56 family metallopeptidase [Mitsuaria sp. GD03876]MDH0867943.1 M56 family metallopeptidase [Mitsuaria sp. GD03876]
MIDALLHGLLRQAALLSAIALVLLVARRPLTRHLGPGFAYAAWLALPLLLLVDLLPASRPVTALSAEFLREVTPALVPPASLVAPAVPARENGVWLWLWGTGAFAVAVAMAMRQLWFSATLTRAADGRSWIGEQGPALIGLWPARLVLPPDFDTRFDDAQRELVLAHEAVHRRRFDNHWNALAAALCALHWFNPLAWLALRAMRADQELSCDRAVMRQHPGREADYGRALLNALASPSPLQPWSGWHSAHPLVDRVALLSAPPRSALRRRVGGLSLALVALVAAGVLVTLNSATTPPPGEARIQLDFEFSVTRAAKDGGRDTRTSHVRAIVREGERTSVFQDAGDAHTPAQQLRLDIVAWRPRPDDFPPPSLGTIDLEIATFYDGKPWSTEDRQRVGATPTQLRVEPLDGSPPIISRRITGKVL